MALNSLSYFVFPEISDNLTLDFTLLLHRIISCVAVLPWEHQSDGFKNPFSLHKPFYQFGSPTSELQNPDILCKSHGPPTKWAASYLLSFRTVSLETVVLGTAVLVAVVLGTAAQAYYVDARWNSCQQGHQDSVSTAWQKTSTAAKLNSSSTEIENSRKAFRERKSSQ